jgi:hypothetical protein
MVEDTDVATHGPSEAVRATLSGVNQLARLRQRRPCVRALRRGSSPPRGGDRLGGLLSLALSVSTRGGGAAAPELEGPSAESAVVAVALEVEEVEDTGSGSAELG